MEGGGGGRGEWGLYNKAASMNGRESDTLPKGHCGYKLEVIFRVSGSSIDRKSLRSSLSSPWAPSNTLGSQNCKFYWDRSAMVCSLFFDATLIFSMLKYFQFYAINLLANLSGTVIRNWVYLQDFHGHTCQIVQNSITFVK